MNDANHSDLITMVLNDYLSFSETLQCERVGLLGLVLEDWARHTGEIAARNHAHGVSFNPLTRINIGETSHSRLLGDLLNPHGSHGQGALFLDVLLRNLGCRLPDSDSWHVSVETGRVDILIWRTHPVKSAIIIENKSNNAGDQPNQIYRYWHREMYLWDRELWDKKDESTVNERNKRFHIVYLPADGGRSPAAHTPNRPDDWTDKDNPHTEVPLTCKPLSLSELTGAWFNEALPRIPRSNNRLREFLNHYHELWT